MIEVTQKENAVYVKFDNDRDLEIFEDHFIHVNIQVEIIPKRYKGVRYNKHIVTLGLPIESCIVRNFKKF